MSVDGLVFHFPIHGKIEVATCSEDFSLIHFKGVVKTDCKSQKMILFVLDSDKQFLSYVYSDCDGVCTLHINVFGLTEDMLLDKKLCLKQEKGSLIIVESERSRKEKVSAFTISNFETEKYGTASSMGQSIELLSLTQNYLFDMLSTEDHMEAMTKSYKESDVSVHSFYKLLHNYEQCSNTKEMLRLDALLMYPMLRQLKWKVSFAKLVQLLNLLCEMEIPLCFLLILETCLQHKDIVSERTSLIKIPFVSANLELRKEIISCLCLCRTVMRTVLDNSSDSEIEECLTCITRYLEDVPLMLNQPVIKARSIC